MLFNTNKVRGFIERYREIEGDKKVGNWQCENCKRKYSKDIEVCPECNKLDKYI